MRGSNNTIMAVLFGIMVIGVSILVFLYEPKHDWSETLRTNMEGPYDVNVFQALLDSTTEGEMLVTDEPLTQILDSINNSTYFFFGTYIYLDSVESVTLLDFVARGNTAFIACNQLPEEFYSALDQEHLHLGNQEWTNSEKIFPRTIAEGKKHRFANKGNNGYHDKWWSYMEIVSSAEAEVPDEKELSIEDFFTLEKDEESDSVKTDETIEADSSIFQNLTEGTYTVVVSDGVDTVYADDDDYDEEYDDYDEDYVYDRYEDVDTSGWTRFTTLGYFANENESDTLFRNFVSVKIGSGQLIIHSNPVLFSNYFLMKEDGFKYANEALSHLQNQPVIWDGYHQIYREQPGEHSVGKSPLRFVFDNPPLKYAWFTLLGATLLFLVFKTKREQNIIPIIPAVQNTSIAFAKSLGILYHQASSGRFLAVELMRMFDSYNRRHYGFHRNKKDEESATQISKKSRVDISLVQEIISLELKIVYNPISKIKEVVNLYNRLEQYYKQAKK